MPSSIRSALRFLAPAGAAALLAVSTTADRAPAQQRSLEHEDVLHWNTIASPSLSPDGAWLAFVLDAMEGDPVLTIRAAQGGGGGVEAVVRGAAPVFSSDSRYLAYRVPPVEAVVDSIKREGKKGDDLPKDSLAVVELAALFQGDVQGEEPRLDAIRMLGPVEGFEVAPEGGWMAYEPVDAEDVQGSEEEPDAEEAEEPGAEPAAEEPAAVEPGAEPAETENEDNDEDRDKEEGSPLVLRDLATGDETRYEHVTEYEFAEESAVIAFATSTEDGSADGVHVVTLDDGVRRTVMEGEGRYEQLAVAQNGERVAFLSDRDDYEADQPEFVLYQGSAPGWQGDAMADSDSQGLPEGWWVGRDGDVTFSEGGGRIAFGAAPRPEPEEEDDTLEEDKVVLDVWNWRDPYLQPMQLVRAEEERKRTYAAVVSVDGGPVAQLGSPDVPTVRFAAEGDATHALGVTDAPYRQQLSWDGRYNDLYALDMSTGERRRVVQRVKGFGGGSISPAGKYAAWWDGAERHWMVARLDGGSVAGGTGSVAGETGSVTGGAEGQAMAASAQVPHPVWNELDDHPDLPPPYGAAGWTEGDAAFLFYDRFDVWRFDPEAGTATNLTEGAGRNAGLRFRYARTEPELDHIPEGEALWQAFHYANKQGGFYRGRTDRAAAPRQVVLSDHAYRLRGKAEDADRWLVTREDFREFPDLRVADRIVDGDGLTEMVKVSDANPQQAEHVWGSAEIVEWNSNDGVPLQGILYKPDGFDPTRKHPMMVYFYERMSDGIHNYRSPRPGGSSVSVPFYVSRGYVVFIPDIPYEIGYPGESALDAVVPGVLRVVAEGFVDREKIGVQGHSWGGYQIAYMITKTNLFAAAEAGAPVSNMTSAYGGIRWQSGMSRMFQYERTQSRIGGTLWESTAEYLHNSPLFYADKIDTPLLMMHNDEDGAVPWYQGIEMFVAMRRLQKPVWMLNYNGEAHGLRKEANRKDWAVRMQQFFDHYLKDAPAPVWMEEGIPAVEKGKTLGTEPARRKVS